MNTLKLVGPHAVLQDLVQNRMSFSHYVPVSNQEDTHERRTAWGTRSEPLNLELEYSDAAPNCLIARFLTIWAPPTSFLEKLLARFPTLWIKLEFTIEGGIGSGLWILYQKHGEVIEKCIHWEEPVLSETNQDN